MEFLVQPTNQTHKQTFFNRLRCSRGLVFFRFLFQQGVRIEDLGTTGGWGLALKSSHELSYPTVFVYRLYRGFLKWWVSPTTIGFPTKNHQNVGWRLGVPPFKETPIYTQNKKYHLCMEYIYVIYVYAEIPCIKWI